MRSPTTLLQDAWEHVKTHFQLFAAIYVLPAALSIGFALAYGSEPDMGMIEPSVISLSMLFVVVLFIVNILAGIAMIRAISHPQESTFQSAYAYGKHMFFPYLWVGLLTGFAVMIGFVLLIIPGIIFMVWFLFSYMAVLIDDKRGTGALKMSKEIGSGHWWGIFGRLLLLILVSILISAAFGIAASILGGFFGDRLASALTVLANFIIVPLSLTYVYYMYQDLKTVSAAGADGAPVTETDFGTSATVDESQISAKDTSPEVDDRHAHSTAINTQKQQRPPAADLNDGVEENKKQGY